MIFDPVFPRQVGRTPAAVGGGQQRLVPVLVPGRRPATVRVWRLDLADPGVDVEAAAERLTAAERDRAGRGSPSVRRRRVLLRAGLRQVLGELLDVRPEAVPIVSDLGRPVVGGRRCGRRPQVSCSASAELGLIGISTGVPIGVDVQHWDSGGAGDAVAEGWLTDGERSRVEALPRDEHPRALARAWAQKEAVLKGEGCGLLRPPMSVLTPVADHGQVGPWSLSPLEVPGRAVACLALRCRSDGRQPAGLLRGRSGAGPRHPFG